MMLHAYSSLYLDKSSRTLGNMLHDAVIEFGMDGTDFLLKCMIEVMYIGWDGY